MEDVERDENGRIKLYEGIDGGEDMVSIPVEMDGVEGYTMIPLSKYKALCRGSKKNAKANKLRFKKKMRRSR